MLEGLSQQVGVASGKCTIIYWKKKPYAYIAKRKS